MLFKWSSILQTIINMCTAGQAIECLHKTTFEMQSAIRSGLFLSVLSLTSYFFHNEKLLFAQSIFWADGHHLGMLYSKRWHHLFFFLSFSPLLNETLRAFLGHVSLLFFCVTAVTTMHSRYTIVDRSAYSFFAIVDKGWHYIARLFIKDQLGNDVTDVVFSYLECQIDMTLSLHIFGLYFLTSFFVGHWALNVTIFSFLLHYRWEQNETALKYVFYMSTLLVYLFFSVRVLVECGMLPKPRNRLGKFLPH